VLPTRHAKHSENTILQLLDTNTESKKLSKEQGYLFHHLVAKLLYLTTHSRQDIQMAVASLCVKKTQTFMTTRKIH